MATAILTQGKESAALINLTIPMILGISSNLIAAIFETYLIGQIGTTELAAYSFTSPVVMGLTSFMLGLSIGLSSVLARAVGTGDHSRVSRLATDGVILMAVVMFVLASLGYISIIPLFSAMRAEGETLGLIHSYMSIWYFGLIFLCLPSMGSNALRATGDAKISGSIMVGGAILQMILDPILILGLFGFPQLGIEGAAYAMVISRFILCCVTFYILIFKKDLIIIGAVKLKELFQSWKQILHVGLPATATNLIGPISNIIVVGLLAGYGDEVVAGFGIASRIEALFIIPLFALSASIGPFVGQNWGASERRRANKGMKLAFAWSMTWGLIVATAFFFIGPHITALLADDATVVEYASLYLLIVPVSYGFWGVLMMASATFNSLGKPLASTTLSIVRMLVIYVPLAYLGEHLFGVAGIFGAACISNIIVGSLAFAWNRRTYVKRLDKGSVKAPSH